jgi:hypothetical protein
MRGNFGLCFDIPLVCSTARCPNFAPKKERGHKLSIDVKWEKEKKGEKEKKKMGEERERRNITEIIRHSKRKTTQ